MKALRNHGRHDWFISLTLAVFAELALPMMGQVPAPVPKVEPATAAVRQLPIPAPAAYASEDPSEPPAMPLYSRSFFVDPYQFDEVVRPKLLDSEQSSHDGTGVFRSLRQWLAQLGVDMNTNGKAMFWHDDGRLRVRASSADLDTIEAAIKAMAKEYSGKPHPPLEIRVIHLAPDAFEEGLRKLRLLPEADNSPSDVGAALLRRFAELGVNLARPKTLHYNRTEGYLAVCATRADLEIVEPELVRLQVTPAQPLPRRK